MTQWQQIAFGQNFRLVIYFLCFWGLRLFLAACSICLSVGIPFFLSCLLLPGAAVAAVAAAAVAFCCDGCQK